MLNLPMGAIDRFRNSSSPFLRQPLEAFLAARAVFFAGTKYVCPCCGWKLRAFTHGGTSLRVRPLGYCPRCNSKARHRRLWLFLEQKTNLFSDPLCLFHASPAYGLSRRLMTLPNLHYVGMAERRRPNIGARAALTDIPVPSGSFDAVLCNHVLEHIPEDRKAIRELYRVLRPGGWAAISTPIRLDRETFEDPTVTSPAERERLFGETVHVRFYGRDLADRLEEPGFHVSLDLGKDVDVHTRERYGLRDDENIFYCVKDRVPWRR